VIVSESVSSLICPNKVEGTVALCCHEERRALSMELHHHAIDAKSFRDTTAATRVDKNIRPKCV